MAGNYTLITGEEGGEQLDNLNRWFGEESRKFLLSIGLKPGMHVLDVGCGVGNLSRWMAEIVATVLNSPRNRRAEATEEYQLLPLFF